MITGDSVEARGGLMSFAPATILAVRRLIQVHVPQLSAVELGIVGDDAHANSGTSYHLGKDALKPTSYSIIESPRDRNGLSDAASALDIGWFKITVKGKAWTLRDLSMWLVGQCRGGAAGAGDIREIIYSPDGKIVKRWDRLGIRSSGDNSHLTHTHISWHRDSERRDKTALFTRWFRLIGAINTPEDDVTEAELIAAVTKALKAADGQGAIAKAAGVGVHNQVIGRGTTTIGQALQTIAGQQAKLAAVEALLADIAKRPDGAPTVAELIEALRAVLREGTGE